ncbi:MAG: hypothetical protein J7K13_00030 [Thermoplasmata archaeon]|nr:hypothetical protein [Thermoplasmata archaeon]
MQPDDADNVRLSSRYYNEYPIPRNLVISFFVRLTVLITYYALFVTAIAIIIFSLMCYFNIKTPSGKATDLILVSFLLALVISAVPSLGAFSPSLPGKVFIEVYKRLGASVRYLDLNGSLTFAVLPIIKWIEKNVKCPSCGGKLKEGKYCLSTKSFFKFSVYCSKCGFKELKTGAFDTVLRFSLPSGDSVFDLICDGKITEKDIWREISEDEVSSELKKMVEVVKKYFTVTQVVYKHKNRKFTRIFYPYLSIYPFFIYGDKFAICKTDDPLVNEILVSRKEILFVNYNYSGEYTFLEYSPQSKRFIGPYLESEEGVKITDTARELYNVLKNDRELCEKLRSYMKDNLFVGSRKRRLSFEELREYLSKYRPEYSLAETEFLEKEKEAIVGVHIFMAYSPIRDKIKLQPEYFDIARRILGHISQELPTTIV